MWTDIENRYAFKFIWEIENFSSCFQKNKQFITSPEFTVNSLNGSRWCLRLYPRGETEESIDYVSLFLKRIDVGEVITIDDKVELIRPNGDCFEYYEGEHSIYESLRSLGWRYLLLIEKLNDEMESWTSDTLTIHYYMVKSKPIDVCQAKTTIAMNRCYTKWYVGYPDSTNWSVCKPITFSEASKFKVTLTAPEDYILINVLQLETVKLISNSFLTCRIALLDTEGAETYFRKSSHLFETDSTNRTWEFPSFFTKKQLKSEEFTLLKNDTFTLQCECTFSDRIEINEKLNCFSTLKSDLRNMYEEKKHSDVVLQCENMTLSAHKLILSSRSPVFYNMFKINSLENQTGVINIVDCDAQTLTSFLEFLYTDTVTKLDAGIAIKLLLVADKYHVKSLEEKCVSLLISALSVDNLCDVIGVADLIGNRFLKTSAFSFIKTHSVEILSSPDWLKWVKQNIELATEMFSMCSLNIAGDTTKLDVK